jgi:hypothetical protein
MLEKHVFIQAFQQAPQDSGGNTSLAWLSSYDR